MFSKVSSKDIIAQEILSFEAVGRVSKLLDQFMDGLRTLGVLQAMCCFPEKFIHLFIYTANVSAADVLETLYYDGVLDPSDAATFNHLTRFIIEGSEHGMLCHRYYKE